VSATIVTVVVVFDGGERPLVAPEQIADALLSVEEVTTVRIADHGRPSVYRADVADGEEAVAIAAAVAERLGLTLEVTGVTLTADEERERPATGYGDRPD
jgi:hypothetical protein